MTRYLHQATVILQERCKITGTFEFDSEPFGFYVGLSFRSESVLASTPCLPCTFQIVTTVATGDCSVPSGLCQIMQPKLSRTRSVICTIDGEEFITNQIFVDGDPIHIKTWEFDLSFYLDYVNRFIRSESK